LWGGAWCRKGGLLTILGGDSECPWSGCLRMSSPFPGRRTAAGGAPDRIRALRGRRRARPQGAPGSYRLVLSLLASWGTLSAPTGEAIPDQSSPSLPAVHRGLRLAPSPPRRDAHTVRLAGKRRGTASPLEGKRRGSRPHPDANAGFTPSLFLPHWLQSSSSSSSSPSWFPPAASPCAEAWRGSQRIIMTPRRGA